MRSVVVYVVYALKMTLSDLGFRVRILVRANVKAWPIRLNAISRVDRTSATAMKVTS